MYKKCLTKFCLAAGTDTASFAKAIGELEPGPEENHALRRLMKEHYARMAGHLVTLGSEVEELDDISQLESAVTNQMTKSKRLLRATDVLDLGVRLAIPDHPQGKGVLVKRFGQADENQSEGLTDAELEANPLLAKFFQVE